MGRRTYEKPIEKNINANYQELDNQIAVNIFRTLSGHGDMCVQIIRAIDLRW